MYEDMLFCWRFLIEEGEGAKAFALNYILNLSQWRRVVKSFPSHLWFGMILKITHSPSIISFLQVTVPGGAGRGKKLWSVREPYLHDVKVILPVLNPSVYLI